MLYTFFGVTLVLCAELAWWVTFNVRASHRMTEAAITRLDRDVALADAVIVAAAQHQGIRPSLPSDILATAFAELQWSATLQQNGDKPASSPSPSAALQVLYPNFAVTIRPEVIAQVRQGHHTHRRMFYSEGGFFLAMVLLGATLIFRTLRREVGLMRQQANFLAAVSHELKSPLASLRLYTETMQLRRIPEPTQARYFGIMRIDIDRLETLVGNLLAVARLDHGEQVARPHNIDVCRAVEGIVSDMRDDLLARGTKVVLQLSATPLYAALDLGVLTTVLRNLLDNAAKYNQHNADVCVRVTAAKAQVVIEVVDQGIGLEPKELGHIFQKFYRVGDEMVRQAEGSGLGLYLVAALWRQTGGSVWAHSPGLLLGTTLTLSVPKIGQIDTE